MFMTTLLLWNNPLLSFKISIVSEVASIGLYYLYEHSWRKYITNIRLKKGMDVLLIGNDDKHNWYSVVEEFPDGKILIEVV